MKFKQSIDFRESQLNERIKIFNHQKTLYYSPLAPSCFRFGFVFNRDWRGAWITGFTFVYFGIYFCRDAKGKKYFWFPPFTQIKE